jgi:sulfite oxidase
MLRRDLLELGALATIGAIARAHAGPGRMLVQGERPQELATPLATFDRLETPTEQFFIRSHFGPPALDPKRRVKIGGLVKKPLELAVTDLARFTEVTLVAVLQCAGNGRSLIEPHVPGVQWGHGAVGQASWTGVRLHDVLDAAGVDPATAHIHLAGADLPPKPTVPAFARSIPIARAIDPTTLIAYRMNSAPLRLAHGAPLRLVVPGWAGNHWVKWLAHVEAAAAPATGFFMDKGYRVPTSPVTPGTALTADNSVPLTVFPVTSLIARPGDGETIARGRQEIVGVAFAGAAAIAKVEIQLDDGAWQRAKLEGAAGPGRWQVFRLPFDAASGRHRATARATDASGAVQPEHATWNPSGYHWNAWHRVTWEVA